MDSEETDRLRKWLRTGSINIFGRPFAGKDTQAAKLAELLGAAILGGGDILRNSVIPPHVDEALRRGELIPSDDYVNIVLPYLSKAEFSDKPLILSSVGRWSGEEEGVISALNQAGHALKLVIYLDISEEIVRERWQKLDTNDDRGGRFDDTAEVLNKRLTEYREKTLPVIEVYRSRGLLVAIDGNQAPEAVFDDILRQLNSLAS